MRERERLQERFCIALCLAIAAILIALPLPFHSPILAVLLAAAFYVLLGRLGGWLEAHAKRLSRIITCGASLSYSAYLTHSVVLNHFTPDGLPGEVSALLICLLLTWASAAALHAISGWLLRRIDALLSTAQ